MLLLTNARIPWEIRDPSNVTKMCAFLKNSCAFVVGGITHARHHDLFLKVAVVKFRNPPYPNPFSKTALLAPSDFYSTVW